MINKFGLSDSLIDAARKVMAGEKVEEEPKADDQPKEEQQLDEAGFVNRKDNMPAGKELGKVMKDQGKTFFQSLNDRKARGVKSKPIDKDKFFGKK